MNICLLTFILIENKETQWQVLRYQCRRFQVLHRRWQANYYLVQSNRALQIRLHTPAEEVSHCFGYKPRFEELVGFQQCYADSLWLTGKPAASLCVTAKAVSLFFFFLSEGGRLPILKRSFLLFANTPKNCSRLAGLAKALIKITSLSWGQNMCSHYCKKKQGGTAGKGEGIFLCWFSMKMPCMAASCLSAFPDQQYVLS